MDNLLNITQRLVDVVMAIPLDDIDDLAGEWSTLACEWEVVDTTAPEYDNAADMSYMLRRLYNAAESLMIEADRIDTALPLYATEGFDR